MMRDRMGAAGERATGWEAGEGDGPRQGAGRQRQERAGRQGDGARVGVGAGSVRDGADSQVKGEGKGTGRAGVRGQARQEQEVGK